ncbi:MAG: (Fe-S)-binding protein [Candidatus Bathyarchaeia archaeon]
MADAFLKKHEYSLLKCVYCGQCRYVCPMLVNDGWESTAPRGKIQLIYGWKKGEIPADDYFIEKIYQCSTCDRCTKECPSGVPVLEILKDARRQLVKEKIGPYLPFKYADENIVVTKNPLGKPFTERSFWRDLEGVNKVDYKSTGNLYFVGCMPSYWCTEIAGATYRVLEQTGERFMIFDGDEWCCGMLAFWDGNEPLAHKLARRNVKQFHRRGVKKIITTCPGCYITFKHAYRKIFGKLDFQVLHLVEYLSQLYQAGKLNFTGKMRTTVTYHDSCHLGRSEGIYDQPRELIRAVPGVKLVEMKKNRENANCCGGLLTTAFPDLAIQVGLDKIHEALETGAEKLITSCPQCYIHLRKCSLEAGGKIEIIDLSSFIYEAMQKQGEADTTEG